MPAKVLPDAEEFARFTEALVRHGHGRARRFAQQASALALRSDGARDGKSVVLENFVPA